MQAEKKLVWTDKRCAKIVRYVLDLLYYVFQERQSKEVIGYISCIEHQSAIGAALLSCCQSDLTVFYHLVTPIHLTDHTHRLRWIGFLYHLQTISQQYVYIVVQSNNNNKTI